ncbi:MAG TPA: winged helix-turn-helix domain-containing protein, partial [Myxococcota bacterium]|nr:winged helix-turn-helix domain-containing protein [Myxococcota bacterium]
MTDSSARSQRVIAFGVFEIDPSARELRKQGRRVRLQEQPLQVLEMLLARPGEIVTREELHRALWPGSITVDFDHGLNNAVARLRDVLGDHAASPQFIETLPRRGYRFVYPLAAPTVSPAAPAEPEALAPPSVSKRRRRFWLSGAALAVVLAGGAALVLPRAPERARAPEPATATAPSIAVLPFVNLSADPENDHFADGLTEELVSKLAEIRGLDVVARTSSHRFKGSQQSSTQIARALQVNHLLEGGVRRSGDRLRITAQLIDAREDKHLWSQTFDRAAGDIFQIQEEIAFAVAAALRVSLLDADETRIRRHGTRDPEAHRLYLIAQSHLLHRTRASDPEVAKRSLEAALARDPEFAEAHAGLARFYFIRAWSTLADAEQSARLGAAAAARAVALDPESSEARHANANFQFWRYRFRGDFAA